MYKIVIADDEDNVREGIRESLNWHELGFEVVGVFENGREVIQALEQLQHALYRWFRSITLSL